MFNQEYIHVSCLLERLPLQRQERVVKWNESGEPEYWKLFYWTVV